MDIDTGMESLTLTPYILTGAAVAIGYYYRHSLIYRAVDAVNWGVNAYIDIKWKYFAQPELASPLHVDTETRCHVTMVSPGELTYMYRDKQYITKHTLPPTFHELDQFYDEDNAINEVRCYSSKGLITLRENEYDNVLYIVRMFAGPLCDFHNCKVNVQDIVSKSKCKSKCKADCIKIVVNTENYEEYILE